MNKGMNEMGFEILKMGRTKFKANPVNINIEILNPTINKIFKDKFKLLIRNSLIKRIPGRSVRKVNPIIDLNNGISNPNNSNPMTIANAI